MAQLHSILTLALQSALRHGRSTPVPNQQEAVWDSDPVCSLRRTENPLALVGIRTPDRPARTVVTTPAEP